LYDRPVNEGGDGAPAHGVVGAPALDAAAIAALAPGMLFSLAGKVAVVTGAAGGIGRWLAAGLGAAGAAVLATDLDEEGLETLAATLDEAGIEGATLACDLADEDAPERIVGTALQRFGAVHVLVNNAAV